MSDETNRAKLDEMIDAHPDIYTRSRDNIAYAVAIDLLAEKEELKARAEKAEASAVMLREALENAMGWLKEVRDNIISSRQFQRADAGVRYIREALSTSAPAAQEWEARVRKEEREAVLARFMDRIDYCHGQLHEIGHRHGTGNPDRYGDEEECGPPYPFSDHEQALIKAAIMGSEGLDGPDVQSRKGIDGPTSQSHRGEG